MNNNEARLAYARKCVKLAKREFREFKREFAQGQETIYDWAVEYGRSASITMEEIIAAMAPERHITDDIKLAVGRWLRRHGYRTGDPTVPADCGLDVFNIHGTWVCTLTFQEAGARPDLRRNTLFEYANPEFLDLILEFVAGQARGR